MNCALTRAFILFGFIFLLLPKSHAQSVYVGGGAYFGQGACAGGVAIPREIKKIEDKQKDIAKKLRDAETALKKAENEAKKATDAFKKVDDSIKNWLKPHVVSGVILKITAPGKTPYGKGSDPKSICAENGDNISQSLIDAGKVQPWDGYCKVDANNSYSLEAESWASQTGPDSFDIGFCYTTQFVAETNHKTLQVIPKSYNQDTGSRAKDCTDSLKKYAEASGRKQLAEEALVKANADYEYFSQQADALDDEKEIAFEEWQDRQAEGKTAADFCYTCQYGGREVKTSDKILGLTGTLLGAAATYYGVKYVADQNKDMGWPTSPWMAYAMGYPFVMAGIYGAAYGGGAGAFGCSGGAGGGYPAFGYPGGGMYPGGYPGGGYPGAYPAMGYPAGGMAMGYPAAGGMGMMGYAMGYPAAGGMAMGYAMGYPAAGMMMGAAGIGMMGYPAMGMPAMGYPAAGMMMGAAGIGMMGYPAMGMPAMGYPAAGMAPLAGGYMGMAMGYPAAGMMMGAAGIGMMGYPAMGYPAAGGMGMMGYPAMGYPAAGGAMMMGSMASMQYQQQMLQMQQQQMAQWMQEQQRMQQDYMNRQQMVGRLTQELSRIQMQIQMISTGAYGGGSYGGAYGYGGGGYGTGGYPTGNSYDPNSDPNFNNNNPYNGPSRGQGYQIPPRGN